MNDCADFFSRRQQFVRVVALDWRLHRTDILFGLFYALIGLTFRPAYLGKGNWYALAPFVSIGFVLGYLAYRICSDECAASTKAFFHNLPRERETTWTAHVVLLAATALALDTVVLTGVALGFTGRAKGVGLHFASFMPVLPFIVMATVLWLLYSSLTWWMRAIGVSVAIVAWICALLWLMGWLGNIGGFILVVALLALTRRKWLRTQIGEMP